MENKEHKQSENKVPDAEWLSLMIAFCIEPSSVHARKSGSGRILAPRNYSAIQLHPPKSNSFLVTVLANYRAPITGAKLGLRVAGDGQSEIRSPPAGSAAVGVNQVAHTIVGDTSAFSRLRIFASRRRHREQAALQSVRR